MIWFTSDWHIGHDKEFIWKCRGFKSVEDAAFQTLKNCNEFVEKTDTLYILGDLALGQHEELWNEVYSNIKCNDVHFLIGNHDTDRRVAKYDYEYNFICEGYATMFKYDKYNFYLSHYPTNTTNYDMDKPMKTRILNLSGHTHSSDIFHGNLNAGSYNVALDAHINRPINIEDIIFDFKWLFLETYKKEGE